MNRPTVERLRERLEYHPALGLITWRDGRREGKYAFNTPHNGGGLCGNFDKQLLLSHHVAWALYYGYWPREVYHLNERKRDNRIDNLRERKAISALKDVL